MSYGETRYRPAAFPERTMPPLETLDPATSPSVPLFTQIDVVRDEIEQFDYALGMKTVLGARPRYRMVSSGWVRAEDRVHEYTMTSPPEGEHVVVLMVRDLTFEEREWLRKIGART